MSPHISIDRNAVSAFCQRHHIKRLALFGSVLRDDFGPESDVDVLVEFHAGHVPGLNFVSIEREFSGLLHGRRVDMVTPKFLNARIRDQVLSSAEPLYVAAWISSTSGTCSTWRGRQSAKRKASRARRTTPTRIFGLH